MTEQEPRPVDVAAIRARIESQGCVTFDDAEQMLDALEAAQRVVTAARNIPTVRQETAEMMPERVLEYIERVHAAMLAYDAPPDADGGDAP